MGFLTRFLVSKMEDPAKRQADFEAHMVETVAKCEEVYVMLSGESLVPYRHLIGGTRVFWHPRPRVGVPSSGPPSRLGDSPTVPYRSSPPPHHSKKNWNQPTKTHGYWTKDKMQSTVSPPLNS
jgi:hypothetical protein